MSDLAVKQIAFLLYDSRSGSTLLSALLNRYASISVSQESAFISRIFQFPGNSQTDRDIGLMIDHLMKEVQFTELGMPREELEKRLRGLHRPISKIHIVLTILQDYFHRRDPYAEFWVVKHPPYPYIDFLKKAIPGVKFIHIVRDGRAVFSSKRNTHGLHGQAMEDNLLKAASKWRKRTGIAHQYPGLIYEIRYEDLVSHPEATMDMVLDYLEIPLTARKITKSQQDYYAVIGEKQKPLHGDVRKEPELTRVDRWKTGLDELDIFLYERINGDRLASYNYPLVQLNQPHRISFYAKSACRMVFYGFQYCYRAFMKQVRRIFFRKNRLERIRRRVASFRGNPLE